MDIHMTLLSRFGLVPTVTAIATAILLLAIGTVSIAISFNISGRIVEQAIQSQNASLRALATIASRDLEGVEITWNKTGNVDRIVMSEIPTEFAAHDMIDTIGRMTGQTATIFAWDEGTKDFWRKTTNIIKPDGNRAVGTQLGQKGAVYPVLTKGETFRGEAVILGTPYYTLYQPVFSPEGKTIGIFYVGVGSAEINATADAMVWVIGLTAIGILAVATIILTYLNRQILGPIPKLTKASLNLAEGDYSIEVPNKEYRNEIGDLARSLDVFRNNAIEKQTMETKADEVREKSEEERRMREDAKSEHNMQIQSAVDEIGAGLQRLSEGDLSVHLANPFTEGLEKLRVDFNGAAQRLSVTMAKLRDEANEIRNGAEEMRSATDDLSKRTENQAASLEETSAALEEITSTVSTSSKRADEATRVAAEAQSSTVTSREVVSSAVEAMSRIEAASGEISNIINVIDEISFQTNLLALNAGVEAARAGDAGRGFAVVAQEVRELSQRSATAARDIKTLITTSGQEVAVGVKLVNETGDALSGISEQVNLINEHINSIATAAREQNTGLGSINASVNEMDQVTQQNAAMAEEATAVMHSLASSAKTLSGLVEQFKITGENTNTSGAVSSKAA